MRFTLSYGLYRFMGISGTCLLLYIVIIGVFGDVDLAPYLPIKLAASIQQAWPQMPFFHVRTEEVDGGQEIFYTVPTRQLTREEIARMKQKPAAGAGKKTEPK